jgi:hypothetical protein
MNIVKKTLARLFVCGSGARIGPKPKESNPNTTENINPIKLVTSIASAIEHKIPRFKNPIKPIINVIQIIILNINPTHLESFSTTGKKMKRKC